LSYRPPSYRDRTLRTAALLLAALLVAGTYASPRLLAHALGAPAIRISLFVDDGHRTPSANYFISVKVWGLCLRVEWLGTFAGRESTTIP
jgi:hypothetical protein